MKRTGNFGRNAGILAIGVLAVMVAHLADAAPTGYVSLPGHVVPVPSNAKYVGPTLPSQQISVSVMLPVRNKAALDTLVKRLYDPKDSLYGEYLTPQTFAEGYGATQADYDSVKSFLQSKGLAISKEYSNRLLVTASGPASAVQSAFNVKLLQFQAASGRIFHTIDTNPSLPADIALKVQAVLGLDDSAVPQPLFRRSQAPGAKFQPSALTGPGNTYGPTDFQKAYNLTPSALAGAGLTPTLSGTGQVIAVLELSSVYLPADISFYTSYFSSYFGANYTPPVSPVSVDQWNTATAFDINNGGNEETTTDIEDALNIAPGISKLLVFEGTSSMVDIETAMATDTTDTGTGKVPDVVSISWGGGEVLISSAELISENTVFEEMSSQGQTVLVAAGDSGAYSAFGYYSMFDPSLEYTVTAADPAAQPFITSVGGTALSVTAAGAWSSETVWNDSTTTYPEAGGGGISDYWTIPNYQSEYIPATSKSGYSTTMRNVPDITLDADPVKSPYAIYYGGGHTYTDGSSGGWSGIGGTSCASPSWAGLMALANQQRALKGFTNVGFANPTLYRLAASSRYTADFHDIVSGNIGLSGGVPVYSATSGYDLTSGWGSFNGANLISDLAAGNSKYLLWNKSGAASLWKIGPTGSISYASFGPYSGWAPVGLSSDASGNAYILWNHAADGEIWIYQINSSLSLSAVQDFGPFTGWTASSFAVGSGGDIHILWSHTSDGEISLWTVSSNGSITFMYDHSAAKAQSPNAISTGSISYQSYGPFTGWQAQYLAIGPDDAPRVLWNYTSNNTVSLWDIAGDGTITSQSYGPFTGWQAQGLAVGSDNASRILWKSSSKQFALWNIASGGPVTQTFGPYTNWVANSLASSPSGAVYLVWDNTSTSQLSLWDIESTGTLATTAYGPYAGYQAVSVAAGP